MNISELNLPIRIQNALFKCFAHIETVSDLYEFHSKHPIVHIRGIGKKAFSEINKALKEKGLEELK